MTEEIPPFVPDDEHPGLAHDKQGDVWERHAGGPKRDREADREIREAISREQEGEYDPVTGQFRPSTWEPI